MFCSFQFLRFEYFSLRHICYNMRAKASTQFERFFTRCSPIAFTFLTDVSSGLLNISENSKTFMRTLEFQFWQPWRKNFASIFDSQSESNKKITFPKNSSNKSSGQVESSFDKMPKVFTLKANFGIDIFSLRKTFSSKCSSAHVEYKFHNHAVSFWTICESFPLKVRKLYMFYQSKNFLKIFLWTNRIQFWQPWPGNVSPKRQNFPAQVQKWI